MDLTDLSPLSLLKPRRQIHGISAILLPFTESGAVDWPAFDSHLLRTAEAELTPAVDILKLRGWLTCDHTHPGSPPRPASDIDVLREIGQRMGVIT